MKHVLVYFSILIATCAYAQEQTNLELPNPEEAKEAFFNLMPLPDSLKEGSELKLGTCIPALEATHKDQVACTAALVMASSSSETQLDFYKNAEGIWIAQPSVSQDELPFPDDKLR